MITKKAHAKLNLSLDVTGKRENGYHDIKTLMVMTDLYDEMKFSKSDKLEILGDFDFDMKENFIYKAYLALRDYVGKDLPFKVEIEKNIPNFLEVCFSRNKKNSGLKNDSTRSIWNTLNKTIITPWGRLYIYDDWRD